MRRVSAWLLGTGTIPSPEWAPNTVPCNPFRWFFTWSLMISSHGHAGWWVFADYSRETPCRSQGSLFLKRSLVWCSALWAPVVLFSTDSHLCPHNPGNPPGSAYVPCSAPQSGNSQFPQGGAIIGLTSFLSHLLGLTVLCYLQPVSWNIF